MILKHLSNEWINCNRNRFLLTSEVDSIIVFTEMTVSGSEEVKVEVAEDVKTEQSCWALNKAWSNSSARPVTSVSLSVIASMAISLSPIEFEKSSEFESVSLEALDESGDL